MTDIILKSNVAVVKNIIGKSTAKMFNQLTIGDKLRFYTTIQNVGISRNRSYAVFIIVENLDTNESVKKSFNELSNILDKFDFELEIDNLKE